jgi:serine/threonine-protein kinase
VVLDFGIALAVRNAAEGRKTQTGISVGTPQYMSPEQAAGEKVIDGRADIYALGTLLYEMLAGEPPHTGRSAQQIITKVMSGDVRPVTMTRPSVPAHIARAVQRALARVPADRFATAEEFVRALENHPAAEPSDAVSGTVDAADSVRASSRALEAAGRWRILAIGATAAAVAMLAVTIRAVRQPVPAEPVRRYMLATDPGEALAGDVIASRIAIAPDGSRLVYVGGRRGELLLRNRDELHATPIPGTVGGVAPAFSPNGQRVAFVTLGGAVEVIALDGSPAVTISDSLGGRGGIAWMTEEILIADGNGIGELIRVEARPGALPRRLTTVDRARGEVDHTAPQGLPGGRGVVFSILYAPGSNRAPSIAVADLTTGSHRVLFDGVNARWSETGHLVYATSDGTLMAVPFDARALTTTGAPVVVARGVRMLGALADVALSSDGTLVYAIGAGPTTDRELGGVDSDRIIVVDNWTATLGGRKAQAR